MIRIKRVYDPPMPEDGVRILVDRVWPRGMKKEKAALDHWFKEIAPSSELRKWFAHEPAKWGKFKQRYRAELQSERKEALLREIAEKAEQGTVTLVYAAADREYNNAAALQFFLENSKSFAS
ncbi:MAG: DUF488 domain-containing protein [Desulfovibrionales bacterium]